MEKTTSKEFAQGLLHALRKFSDHFYEDFGQRAQNILGMMKFIIDFRKKYEIVD